MALALLALHTTSFAQSMRYRLCPIVTCPTCPELMLSCEALIVLSSKHQLSVFTMRRAASRQGGCGCRAGRARRGRGAAPPLHDSWPPGVCAPLGLQVCCLLLLLACPAPSASCFLLRLACSLLLLPSQHCNGLRLCLSCFLLLPVSFLVSLPFCCYHGSTMVIGCTAGKRVCNKSAPQVTCRLQSQVVLV